MKTITPTTIADLGRFLNKHTDCSEDLARKVIRAASSGHAVDLPPALDFAGEVLRGQLTVILGSAAAPVAAGKSPAAVVSTPSKRERSIPLPVESRQTVFRAAAGHRLEVFADALAATSVPDEEALRTIEAAKANLPPEATSPALPEDYMTIAERASGLPEIGSSFASSPLSCSERTKAGWQRAFAKAEQSGATRC